MSFSSSTPPSSEPPRSKYTYKHLTQLRSYTPTTPLRIIAHVDLDAFYAQCETIRNNYSPDLPLAVQQWQSLIAINYPARAFGLSRHISAAEAVKLCPDLILQHVATWKEGDVAWGYHPDAFKNMASHKVSLDPYRMESRKILACIKESLPEKERRVEKASIDEVFLDLSAQIYNVLMERYPELARPPPNDEPNESLPKPPTTALDWAADELVKTGEGDEGEEEDPDWDDVCAVIGSEIIRQVRQNVKEKLGYTCSAGVARNKMLAKIGSGYKKPNQQTVIRNRSIKQFMADMKFTKIRMLGGKLGDEVVGMFGTDTVKDLLEQPLDQLKRLGDDTGTWLYSTIRGEDTSEVNPRTQIKSMLSAKSFRPAINSFEQGIRWVRIFVADIFSRCVEEGVLENKRRPRTINLHHRQGNQTRSKQVPIPQGKPLSEEMLFDLAKNLLAQVVVDGRAWPCSNLSLSVGGFEDGITNNKGIGGFLVRGEEAKAILASESEKHAIDPADSLHRPTKKRRREKGNLHKFFTKDARTAIERETCLYLLKETTKEQKKSGGDADADSAEESDDAFESPPPRQQTSDSTPPSAQPPTPLPHQLSSETYICPLCTTPIPQSHKTEHSDWHFAQDLAKQLQAEERANNNQQTPERRSISTPMSQKGSKGERGRPGSGGTAGKKGPGPGTGAVERGQARLAFFGKG